MNWDIQKIRHAFGGRLVGNLFMRKVVCGTLLVFPSEIIEYVCKKVWFLSSAEDAWAYTFRGDDLKDKHLIFISDELLHQNLENIRYTIAHEIGHVILGHKNSIHYQQTQSEIKHQELEADQFAKKYLDNS